MPLPTLIMVFFPVPNLHQRRLSAPGFPHVQPQAVAMTLEAELAELARQYAALEIDAHELRAKVRAGVSWCSTCVRLVACCAA